MRRVTGDVNAGKSTFVNTLLRREMVCILHQPHFNIKVLSIHLLLIF